MEEVIELFELDKINRRNAAFDVDKCFWMNGQYVASVSLDRFAELSEPFIRKAGIHYGSKEALLPVLAIVKEKIKLLSDVPSWVSYFFTEAYPFDEAALAKTLRKEGTLDHLEGLGKVYEGMSNWTAAGLETTLKETAARLGCKVGALVHPARVAVSGCSVGPSLYHMLEILGKDRVLARFQRASEYVKANPGGIA